MMGRETERAKSSSPFAYRREIKCPVHRITSTTLILEQESRSNISCTLTGIIYAGAGHFLWTLLDGGGFMMGL